MEMKSKQNDSNDVFQNQQEKPNNHAKTDFINFYISVPPLENIAIVKVITILCRQPDVKDAVMQQLYAPPCKEPNVISIDYNPIVENMLNKLSLLPLPNLIKAKVSPVIRPIVLVIVKWLLYICTDIGYDALSKVGYSTLNFLCWTSQGTVDQAKTLKLIIEANYDSGLLECKETVQCFYELACTYCLEDIIPILWKKLSKETKIHYLSRGFHSKRYAKHLRVYWSSVNNNELSRLYERIQPHNYCMYDLEHSIFKNMFSLALYAGNIVGVKYFWGKLTTKEIIYNLEQWVNETISRVNWTISYESSYCQLTDKYADILYFLLSKVSAETQGEVIQKNSHVILPSLFLFWPYQRFLLPTIQTVWESLHGVVYLNLLHTVAIEMNKDKTSETVLKQLCCQSPINLKQCFIHDIVKVGISSYACFILSKLLAIGDIATVKEIISYASVEEKEQITEIIVSLFEFKEGIIYKGNLNVVDQLFQETSISELEIISFKEKIALEWGSDLCCKWFHDKNFEMVEIFLNWSFTSQEQINYFKNDIMEEWEKIDVTSELLKEGEYEFVNRFINWCFCSEQEINQFKKKVALSEPKIVEISKNDWCLFEQFIAWSSLSEEEIDDFKFNVLQPGELKNIIHDTVNEGDFQFFDKLLNWCCHSNKDIKLHKAEYILSWGFYLIVERYGENWELMKQLLNLFSPISLEIKLKVKDNMTDISLNHVRKYLFCLLDGNTEDNSFDQVSSDEVCEAIEIGSDKQDYFNDFSFAIK